jgi:hypothetical protein
MALGLSVVASGLASRKLLLFERSEEKSGGPWDRMQHLVYCLLEALRFDALNANVSPFRYEHLVAGRAMR